MTIDEAKEIIGEIEAIDDGLGQYIIGFDKALNMAIASLEAWEKVKAEIISERNHRRDRGHHEQSTGLSKAIEIIDKHLQEVE